MRISSLHISLQALCLLPALALAGCDPKLKIGELLGEDSSGDASDSVGDSVSGTSDGTGPGDATSEDPPASEATGDETASGTDGPGGSDGTGGSGGSGEPPADDTGAQVVECDVWAQDCPAGQKCAPWANDGGNTWNSLKCVPLDPTPLPPGSVCEFTGDVLDGVDNCEVGSICWDVDDTGFGTCVRQCEGSLEDPSCAEEGLVCHISNDAVLTLCLPSCDPLLQDCPADQVCIDTGPGFQCVPANPDVPGQTFDACEFLNGCDKGLACADSDLASECDPLNSHCCLPFCDLSAPNNCPGAGQECVTWYEEEPPPGNENIGLCQVPG